MAKKPLINISLDTAKELLEAVPQRQGTRMFTAYLSRMIELMENDRYLERLEGRFVIERRD